MGHLPPVRVVAPASWRSDLPQVLVIRVLPFERIIIPGGPPRDGPHVPSPRLPSPD